MIVRPRPGPFDLLFAMRGSIVPLVLPRLLLIALLALALAVADRLHPHGFPEFTAAPFTLLGIALSIFLGFRNNACYDRWWEGRKQWGLLVTETRAFAREGVALLPDPALRSRLLRRLAAFAHLAAAGLRGLDGLEKARPWLPPGEAEALRPLRNRPEAVLRRQAADLAGCLRAGQISDVLYAALAAHLNAMTAVLAGCERIRNTPLPYAYSLLLHRTAWLFCLLMPFGFVGTLGFATPAIAAILAYALFGLDALSDELEEPFGLAANDLPLDALVRVIEIDLLEALGEPAVPPPLVAERFVLR
ncbi:bestrophin [Roseomonas sp. NAR14]|uniref:Bestrophin n=1 Tax=Roseomonas acroporae TaxID=2937791 RepID=A0A9X2BV78_9PROT|nr:bestrophin family ion channel [Roseomonas acroporae]MCK8786387.1 bestrophin [Roseomonas acroporae]